MQIKEEWDPLNVFGKPGTVWPAPTMRNSNSSGDSEAAADNNVPPGVPPFDDGLAGRGGHTGGAAQVLAAMWQVAVLVAAAVATRL
jgi:hypothetical protein